MIPKKIHYCWFGRGPMPESVTKCIESWKKYLPDYELVLWNEDNFDLEANDYVREAYEARKYAFVTDYVRLKVLHDHGGIYMDTDVEVLRNLDDFLDNKAFTGYESETQVPTGIIASEAGGQWVADMLKLYDGRKFIRPNGKPDMTTNVTLITDEMKRHGFKPKSGHQDYLGILRLYPKDYFCPKDCRTGEIHLTDNTYCIHHFSGTWKTRKGFWSRTWKAIRTAIIPLRSKY